MRQPKGYLMTTLAAAAVLVTVRAGSAADVLNFGTGSEGGVYFPAGKAICSLINAAHAKSGLTCKAAPSGGSIANVEGLRTGRIQLGLVQSDWQFHAYNGTSRFKKKGDFKGLRSLMSLYAEPFTVVARADAGVTRFTDLQGKRVNVSNPGSGARGTMVEVMKALGWRGRTFSKVMQLGTKAQAKALCAGEIDVMVFTVGHPSETIRQATGKCGARLVPVLDKRVDKLVKGHPYYSRVTIPAGMYPNNTRRTRTFGVSATIVTTTLMSNADAGKVVKAVFAQLPKLKNLHPALKTLNAKRMVKDGLTAPLHPGARAYFKAAGMM